MDSAVDFFSLSRSELEGLLCETLDESRFRANQLFQWVYQRRCQDFGQMTNISKRLQPLLNELFFFPAITPEEVSKSKDGSRKYLMRLEENDLVETVHIHQSNRKTLCVSSQVGCALGCKFCQTGTMGLKRHLGTSEIIRQVLAVCDDGTPGELNFSNMVFMGMGEPLHNRDNVLRAIDILTDDYGLGLSARRITVSSVGLVPEIRDFLASGTQVNLAISLNATNNEIRSKVMPVNKKYPIELLLQTLRDAPLRRRQRITIEYVMLRDVNDTAEDLKRLGKILEGVPCKINLIPYNENAGLGFRSPDESWVRHWQKALMSQGYVTTVRWSKGRDIDAACGQLVTESRRKRASGASSLAVAPQGA